MHDYFPVQNLDITALNREPAHSPWHAYENEAQALAGGASPNIQPLNGIWQFKLYPNPSQTEAFYTPDNPRDGFVDIPVPSHWELEGHNEPRYTNIAYPWHYQGSHVIKPGKDSDNIPNPPYIPKDNPCGCYYHEFEVKDVSRQIFICFDGVETAYKLWVNGEYVGYSEDSKLPSEFNISPFVKQGTNNLAVQVARFTKATYLEDQDYWHLSGIYGNVNLIYKHAAHISDYQVKAIPHLRGQYGTSDTGEITADVKVSRVPMFADYTVKIGLYNTAGECLVQTESKPSRTAPQDPKHWPTANTARLHLTVPDITPWTTETPVLYKLVITLISPDGEVVDVEACSVGFKKVEILNGILYLNDKRIVIQGVNRHQHHYQTGRTVSRKWMRKEIIEMKRMNINAVRTSHYPCCDAWYELCDELGILVVCEANIETHGVSGQLSQDPAWSGLYLERAVRMVQTFKNHVCIYSWSLGNESGVGPNHGAMAGFIREYDPTRLCQYEDGNPSTLVSDVRGNMYAPIDHIYKMLTNPADTRPIILVEYLYQIRNAGGGLYQFRQLTEHYPRFQGGFVWDWQDKTLEGTISHEAECDADSPCKDGEKFFAHGGDMGESVTDPWFPGYMTNNGIVLSDLRWKPVAYELKQAYTPIVVRPINKIRPWLPYDSAKWQYEVINRTYTKPLSCYEITMVLLENGYEVRCEKLSEFEAISDLAPLQSTTVKIEPNYNFKDDCEYFIEFRVTEKDRSAYAPAGYEVGCFQYEISGANTVRKPVICVNNKAAIPLSEGSDTGFISAERRGLGQSLIEIRDVASYVDDKLVTLSANGIEVYLCRETGSLSLRKGECEYLQLGGTPCLDRPYTGMDTFAGWGGMHNVFGLVRDGSTAIFVDEVELISSNTATVTYKIATNKDGKEMTTYAKNSYTLLPDGELEVDFYINLNRNLSYVARAGVEFTLPAGFENLTYYGLGGNDNYSDRQMSAYMGVHESTVADQHFPFCPPSLCGGHGQTRWLALENEHGSRITFTGHSPFHFHALHNTVQDYQSALYDHKLPNRAETFLHIDAAHSGIGSNMAWSSHLDPAHIAPAGAYNLKFTVSVQ